MNEVYRIHPGDNVAVALRPLKTGESVSVGGVSVTLRADIPAGHNGFVYVYEGQAKVGEGHLADLRAIALVSSIVGEQSSDARSVADELIALLDATELDMEEIRPRVVALTIWLQRQPNGRVQAAITKLLSQACAREA